MITNFIKENKLTTAITSTNGAAGVTTINGAIIDMAGFEGITSLIGMGPIVATAITSVKWQEGDLANLSDAADVAGTGQSIAVADADKLVYVNVFKPRKRYGRIVVLRATANATVGYASYIQTGARTIIVTQPATTLGKFLISPALGTP